MKVRNNKSGFTLLEIIIVIIIVGVLASLALPRLFSTVEFSRSTEALNAIGMIRKSMERCFLTNDTNANCVVFANLDIEDPSASAGNTSGSIFNYTFTYTDEDNYVIIATRVGGDDAGDTVNVTVSDTTGITRWGNVGGAYESIGAPPA